MQLNDSNKLDILWNLHLYSIILIIMIIINFFLFSKIKINNKLDILWYSHVYLTITIVLISFYFLWKIHT